MALVVHARASFAVEPASLLRIVTFYCIASEENRCMSKWSPTSAGTSKSHLDITRNSYVKPAGMSARLEENFSTADVRHLTLFVSLLMTSAAGATSNMGKRDLQLSKGLCA